MPLFAQLFSSIALGFANLFARWLTFGVSMRLAMYTTWMVTFSAFLATVYVCINSLYSTVSAFGAGRSGAVSWVRLFFVGLGMLIPSNAGAVIACVSAVWIATAVYKIKKQGLFMMAGGSSLVV
jgi:hypothetical protein